MPSVLEKLEVKNLGKPDEVRTFEKGKVELVNIAGRTVGRATFQPGWKWSTCVGPIAKTRFCEAAHFGVQLYGKMRVRMQDGSETLLQAGDVLNIPPGHDAWVEGDETVVALDVQGLAEYAKPKGR